MHLMNDNEINSSVKGREISNETEILENQSVYGSELLRVAQTIGKTSTLSNDSCASSTDSGVIITDDTRIYNKHSNNNETNNYRNIQTNDKNAKSHNAKNNCNSKSGNTSYDNSKNNNNTMNSDKDKAKRKHSEDNLKSNKNLLLNHQIDKNNTVNIENVINVGSGNNKRQQRSSICSSTSSRKYSPAVSIRSNTISIISIDENAIDSSVVDSDSDYEGEHGDYIVKKLGQQMTYEPDHPNLLNINKGIQVLTQKISPGSLPPTAVPLSENLINGGTLPTLVPPMLPNTAQIGSIALTNSTDVTFGDKHFYEGPVTIQQIVIDSRNKRKNGENGGNDNPAYSSDGSDPENSTKAKYTTNEPQGPLKFIFNRRAIIISGSIIILTILAGIIIVTTSFYTKQPIRKSKVLGDGDDFRKHIPINSTIGKDNVGGGMILRIVPRDAWLAQPPSSAPIPLATPVERVIVLSTFTDVCDTQAMCVYRVRMTQTLNIESQKYDDIIYNFLIGGDGNVYEGRGWDVTGAHLRGFNSNSISFAYIGTFKIQKPSDKQMNVTKLLLEEGVRLGKLSPDYKIYGAYTLDPASTDVKADELYKSFKNWPHWTE